MLVGWLLIQIYIDRQTDRYRQMDRQIGRSTYINTYVICVIYINNIPMLFH